MDTQLIDRLTARQRQRPDRRKTYGNGNLRSLQERLTPEQQAVRARKILARQTAVEKLSKEILINRLALIGHVQRGFFGRLKWLLIGR